MSYPPVVRAFCPTHSSPKLIQWAVPKPNLPLLFFMRFGVRKTFFMVPPLNIAFRTPKARANSNFLEITNYEYYSKNLKSDFHSENYFEKRGHSGAYSILLEHSCHSCPALRTLAPRRKGRDARSGDPRDWFYISRLHRTRR